MPRAEKRVIEYFVSTQILQSILDLLHAAGKTERSELNAYAYAVLDSCSEQFYGGVRKHFAHAQTVDLYTRPSGRGLGTRLKFCIILLYRPNG